MRAFTSVGIARQAAASGCKVAMVDQGIMRLPMRPVHASLIPQEYLPDLILHMVADPSVLELRRIYRTKVKHNKYTGEARLSCARETAELLHTLPVVELKDALEKYGAKFCEPALSGSEITGLIEALDSARAAGLVAGNKGGRCNPEVCEMIRQLGVKWREIDNSEQDGLTKALQSSMQAILSVLPQRDSQRPAPQPAMTGAGIFR